MKSRLPASARLALLLLSLVPVGRAADTPAAVTPPPPRQPVAAPEVISLDFAGGTMADLINAIARNGNVTFNVIGEKADLATAIPPFSVRNADRGSLVRALAALLYPRGLTLQTAGGGGDNMFYLAARNDRQSTSAFESFQMASFLQHQSIDDIVSAIRLAWGLNPSRSPEALQLKYHPSTRILLVAGTADAIAVSRRVISTLQSSDTANAATAGSEIERRRALRDQAERAQAASDSPGKK